MRLGAFTPVLPVFQGFGALGATVVPGTQLPTVEFAEFRATAADIPLYEIGTTFVNGQATKRPTGKTAPGYILHFRLKDASVAAGGVVASEVRVSRTPAEMQSMAGVKAIGLFRAAEKPNAEKLLVSQNEFGVKGSTWVHYPALLTNPMLEELKQGGSGAIVNYQAANVDGKLYGTKVDEVVGSKVATEAIVETRKARQKYFDEEKARKQAEEAARREAAARNARNSWLLYGGSAVVLLGIGVTIFLIRRRKKKAGGARG